MSELEKKHHHEEEHEQEEECCCRHHPDLEHEECHHEHKRGEDSCDHDHNHDHEHEHEEECCCGHHHEEEHEHEEGCCCGHHHEEEHEHEEGCCCGHDHEHEHGHEHSVPGYKLFETHNHEGAAVCSFEKEIKSGNDKTKTAVEAAFKSLRDYLNSKGAIIGHVKGYIKENGPATTFSTVGAELNVIKHEGNGAVLGFAAIVFGIDEEALEEKVIETFACIE